MSEEVIDVYILIVSYNGREYLDDCLTSIANQTDPSIRTKTVLVDNASTDGTLEHVEANYPYVTCLAAGDNLGFAGGNTLGWEHINRTDPDARYVCLLNQDTIVDKGWLRALVDTLEAHDDIACAQAKLLLHPETDRINTVGNECHYLGFGFTAGAGEIDRGQYDGCGPDGRPRSIDFPSGAASILRASVLREVGLFDPRLFMYMEDVELAWKIRQLGYDIVYVPASRVYHKYEFGQVYDNYYYMERNRWWLLLTYYKVPTLLLLAPALVAMECGQFWFSWRRGRLADKWRSYAFFWSGQNRRELRSRRRAAQRRRKIGDRRFMWRFAGPIRAVELDGWIVRYLANPLFGLYWLIARRLIFW